MAFPTSEASNAYSALVLAIKNDPVLRREIKTLVTWTGGSTVPPSSGNTPFIRLKPRSAPGQDWLSNQHVGDDLLVDVRIVLEGSDVRVMMDAWQALERAIMPKDEAEFDKQWDRYIAAGIGEIALRQGPIDVEESGGGQNLVGTGQIMIRRSWRAKNPG